jgi:hypothetical protein
MNFFETIRVLAISTVRRYFKIILKLKLVDISGPPRNVLIMHLLFKIWML